VGCKTLDFKITETMPLPLAIRTVAEVIGDAERSVSYAVDVSHALEITFGTWQKDLLQSRPKSKNLFSLPSVHFLYTTTDEKRKVPQTKLYSKDGTLDEVIGELHSLLRFRNNILLWFSSDNGPENNTLSETNGLQGHNCNKCCTKEEFVLQE